MILNRVYEDFISHTNLTDPMYKSVFQKLSDIITDVNSIIWKRMIYTMNGNVYDIDFETNRILPVYIVDLLQNVFEHNFLFPTESITIVMVEYKGNPYEIRVEGGITKIPHELNFLMYSKLFSFYYVSNPIENIYDEFDRLFQILDTFKSKPVEVYSLLRKQFDGEFVESEIQDKGITQDNYIEDSMIIESLEKKRGELLQELETLQKKKEDILNKQKIIKNGYVNREKLLNEQEILKEEFRIAEQAHNEYLEDSKKYENLIKELSENIEGLSASIQILESKKDKTEEDENSIVEYSNNKNYFVEKRLIFDKELLSSKKRLNDSTRLIKDVQARLTVLGNDLTVIEGYSSESIEALEKEQYFIDKKYETIYSEVVELDHDIKVKKDQLKKDDNLRQKSSSLMDVNIQFLEKKDIVDHLSKALKPQPVIIVENYLRYYFSYYVKKAVDVVEEASIDKIWLNAIMVRKVLETYFGVQPNTLFSTIQFNPKSVKNFINVSRG